MDSEQQNEVCPVCTLYLRPGITLKEHLASHPKQKVIEALVRLANTDPVASKEGLQCAPLTSQYPLTNGFSPGNLPGVNHSIIYQQFMSSSGPQPNIVNLNPMNQQYITVPTVFNPQMLCSPYVYQQQQVIMSSGGSSSSMIPRPLSIEMPAIRCIDDESNDESSVVISCLSPIKADEEDEKQVLKKDEELTGGALLHSELMLENDEKNGEIAETKAQGEDEGEDEDENEDRNVHVQEPEEDLSKACQTTAEQILTSNSNYVDFGGEDPEVEMEAMEGGLNFIEMDGMKLVLSGEDFMTNQVISQVDEYECVDRSRILMTIGGMEVEGKSREEEEMLTQESLSRESLSRESANIRADERMPARGELSGQESNECSDDMVWCKLQYNHDNSREDWEPLESCSDIADTNPTTPADSSTNHTSDAHNAPAIEVLDKSLEPPEAAPPTRKRKVKTEQPDADEKNFDKLFRGNAVKIEADPEPPTRLPSSSALCTLCNQVLSSAKELRQHKLEVHKAACKHKCATCGSVFPSEPLYTSHLQIHPLECKLCGKLFYRKQGLELHLKRHLGIKPYKCDVCAKAFLTKQKREEHRNVHTGASPIKCSLCDETFRRYSNLIQHRNRHHLHVKKKLKDFVCHCGEVFHSKKKLAWHKEIHEAKPKACTHCSEKFLHMSSLTRHMRRAHNENYVPKEERSKENVECPICKGVYLKTSLEMHIRNHSGQRPFTCLICNKAFTTKWNLKLHKWTHAARTSKPFKCDQCKGAFIRESDYVAHMNSHKSVRPYTCNYCGAQFIRKYNCQRHVREHEKSKTFVCDVCNKEFHRSYYLKDHMRIHSGVRPYACSICGKTSTTKSNHNKHVRIHHAREPVSTEN